MHQDSIRMHQDSIRMQVWQGCMTIGGSPDPGPFWWGIGRVGYAPPLLADVTPAALAELRLEPGVTVWASFKATDVETYPQLQE